MELQSITNFSSLIPIGPLLPETPTSPKSIIDIFPKSDSYTSLYSILSTIYSMQWAVISFTGQETSAGYEKYLQFPNSTVNALAKTIVNQSDTDDVKMYKIEQWVQDNIKYVSDTNNYGTEELWVYPTVTLRKRSGDCEDGAFLMHSLALHAGISPEKLRTYGGLVYADQWGLTTGGHAWTAYKRSTDNEWVITDWCYWAKDTPISEREPMSDDFKYIDDYFYVQAGKTVETPYANKVRYAYNEDKGGLFNTVV